MYNIVPPDQMFGDIAKGIKEIEGDVAGKPLFCGIVVGRDVEAVELGRGRNVREKLHEPHCVARADVCDLEILVLGRDGGT